MRLQDLVTTSAAVAAASGRLEKIGHLADLLRRLPPGDVEVAVAFLSGRVRQGRTGIGPATVFEARPDTASPEATLELRDVDDAFARTAAMAGPGAPAERARVLRHLLTRATRQEQDFLIRLLAGELRQGALEGVLLEAVASASGVAAPLLRRAAMMAGDLALVAPAVLEAGEAGLAPFEVELMRPVQPMLAQPADDLAAAWEQLGGDVAVEWKLDGARIQVHKAGGDVRVFSRTLRDVTPAVPEIVDAARQLGPRELILDGEAIALKADGTPHPFQTTMQRFGRRLDVDRQRRELPLTPVFFDCLYVDGQPLLDHLQSERFQLLAGAAPSLVVAAMVRPSRDAAERFAADALARGHEGVMVKALASRYLAGRRGQHWLKVKTARTLDLVVLAAEWGHGRRRGWLSNLHLGARDPDHGSFVMLGKTFKGMTDALLTWQTEQLLAREVSRDAYTVFVRPELVVEIAFNDLQRSPHYPGGLALRFARVKGYRPDKRAEDADTIETVREIFRKTTGEDVPRLLF